MNRINPPHPTAPRAGRLAFSAIVAVASLVIPASLLAQAKDKLVPLPIQLPKPMFEGTPQNVKVPNLQKPLGRARDPFLAPAGVTNVAKGKAVTSSDMEPIIGEIDQVTDGDKKGADGSYVELGPLQQQVTIDLGAPYLFVRAAIRSCQNRNPEILKGLWAGFWEFGKSRLQRKAV